MKRVTNFKAKQAGFTVIEMLLVLAIVGLLALMIFLAIYRKYHVLG